MGGGGGGLLVTNLKRAKRMVVKKPSVVSSSIWGLQSTAVHSSDNDFWDTGEWLLDIHTYRKWQVQLHWCLAILSVGGEVSRCVKLFYSNTVRVKMCMWRNSLTQAPCLKDIRGQKELLMKAVFCFTGNTRFSCRAPSLDMILWKQTKSHKNPRWCAVHGHLKIFGV